MSTVIQRYRSGEISIEKLPEALDAAIEEWHEGKSEVELREFLGLCKSEYAFFVQDPRGFLKNL